jgi:multiple sugar transport system substrate-binding protein
MSQEPKKVDRRSFLYIGLGAVALIAIGAAAYVAMNPPVVTQTTTVSTTVPTTSVVTTTVPTTSVVTTTVPTTTVTTVTTGKPTVTVWWEKGYYAEEDKAMWEIFYQFQKQYNVELDVSFYPSEDLQKKLIAAVDSKLFPDIWYTRVASWFCDPQYAWNGLYEDLSDIFEENKNRYISGMAEWASLFNKQTGKRSIYRIPIQMTTGFFHYWKDLLKEAGLPTEPDDIPRKLYDFFDFWKTAQNNLRAKGYKDVYGIGFCLGAASGTGDTMGHLTYLETRFYSEFINPSGEFVGDKPSNRQGLIDTLKLVTDLYKQGYQPTGALTWKDPDNNVAFHSKTVVCTPNATTSIPAAQYFSNKDNYFDKTGTCLWPLTVKGEEARTTLHVIGLAVFAGAKNKEIAKKFIRFFIQKNILYNYLRGGGGRYFPVYKDVLEDPFWTTGFTDSGRKDPHIPMVYKQLTIGERRPYPYDLHPAASRIQVENWWGKAVHRVVLDGKTPEEAIDEQIAYAKSEYAKW